MSWRERLTWADAQSEQFKKASFRDATFYVASSGYSFGRRNIVHKFPEKDLPKVEDLGRDIDQFTITGYVVQNSENDYDYFVERDNLIAALREKGPGKLIHPFHGEKQVNLVGRPSVEESFTQGGIARFTLTFVDVKTEILDILFPSFEIAPQDSVDKAAERALDDTVDAMGANYKDAWQIVTSGGTRAGTGTSLTPNFINTSIQTAIDSLKGMLQSVTTAIQGAFPTAISQSVKILVDAYTGIDLDVIQDACSLGNSVISMFNGLLSLSGQYGDIVEGQLLGSCSGLVRGLNSGPWAGAEQGFDADLLGTIGSPLDKLAPESEDYGKTLVKALLQMNTFGEEIGSANANDVYGGTLDPITVDTIQKAKQLVNQTALVNLVRSTAIILAGTTAIRVAYNSYDSAIEMMNLVVDELDTHLLKLGDDSVDTDLDTYGLTISDPLSYTALMDFRPVFIKAMKDIGADLAKIVEYEVPPTVMSTLELAYSLYDDLGREREIISRNIALVPHPGFLPGGQVIEVLDE